MNTDPLYMWGDLALFAGGPAIILFVAFYGLRSKWESTAAGRSVMALASSLALVFIFIALVLAWPEMPTLLRGVLRLVVYGLVSTAMWALFVSLLRAQHHGRHHR